MSQVSLVSLSMMVALYIREWEPERLCFDFLHLRPKTKRFFKARVKKSFIHLNHLRNQKNTPKATKAKLSLRITLICVTVVEMFYRLLYYGRLTLFWRQPVSYLPVWMQGQSVWYVEQRWVQTCTREHKYTHTNITHTHTRTRHDPADRRSKQAGRTPGACESKLNFGAAS